MFSQEVLKELGSQVEKLDFSKLATLTPKLEVEQRSEEWKAIRRFKFTSSSIHKLMTNPKGKSPGAKYLDACKQLKKWNEEYANSKNKNTKTAIAKLENIEKLKATLPDLLAHKNDVFLSDGAKTYILDKISEELGGNVSEVKNKATEWGEENEDKAREVYILKTGNILEKVGFCEYTDYYGGSPDNKVIDPSLTRDFEGGLEIKCPYITTNHLRHCLIDSDEAFKQNHDDHYWQCVSHMITLNVQWCDFVSFDPRIEGELSFFRYRLKRNEEDVKALLERIELAQKHKKFIKSKMKINEYNSTDA